MIAAASVSLCAPPRPLTRSLDDLRTSASSDGAIRSDGSFAFPIALRSVFGSRGSRRLGARAASMSSKHAPGERFLAPLPPYPARRRWPSFPSPAFLHHLRHSSARRQASNVFSGTTIVDKTYTLGVTTMVTQNVYTRRIVRWIPLPLAGLTACQKTRASTTRASSLGPRSSHTRRARSGLARHAVSSAAGMQGGGCRCGAPTASRPPAAVAAGAAVAVAVAGRGVGKGGCAAR